MKKDDSSDITLTTNNNKDVSLEDIEAGCGDTGKEIEQNNSTDDSSSSSQRNKSRRQAAIEDYYQRTGDKPDRDDDPSLNGSGGQDDAAEDKKHDSSRWQPWKSWSPLRTRRAAYGVLSSIIVLTVRLLLDSEPTAYLIHSIVIFVDMFLIHVFTNSMWLSISGEILTILCVLAFHTTKETVYELLETTLIAALCSFHMIMTRNKYQDRVTELQRSISQLKQGSLFLLQNLEIVEDETLHKWEEEAWNLNKSIAAGVSAASKPHDDDIAPLHVCGEHFFEHFLDGSAGVMYTSFIGLIINELLFYGETKK